MSLEPTLNLLVANVDIWFLVNCYNRVDPQEYMTVALESGKGQIHVDPRVINPMLINWGLFCSKCDHSPLSPGTPPN